MRSDQPTAGNESEGIDKGYQKTGPWRLLYSILLFFHVNNDTYLSAALLQRRKHGWPDTPGAHWPKGPAPLCLFPFQLDEDYDIDHVSGIFKAGFDAAKQRLPAMRSEAVPAPETKRA